MAGEMKGWSKFPIEQSILRTFGRRSRAVLKMFEPSPGLRENDYKGAEFVREVPSQDTSLLRERKPG